MDREYLMVMYNQSWQNSENLGYKSVLDTKIMQCDQHADLSQILKYLSNQPRLNKTLKKRGEI
jgi:hypothetical protein